MVGLSGGVDSAVTAHRLKQQGHEVVGIFMKNWEDDDDSEYCSSRQDFLDAASVADVLGIEIEHVNFAADYKDRVFAEFLREYQAGRTPNPDVLCNAEIKFKAFLDHAMRLGAEKIATGHYARVRQNASNRPVRTAQGRGRQQGPKLLFAPAQPGAAVQRRCSRWASCARPRCAASPQRLALPNAKKKDSTGICFIGERPFRDFLNRYISQEPGPIVDDRGASWASTWACRFTRWASAQGLGIGGVKEKGAARGAGEHAPWFVARKDMARTTPCAWCRGTTTPGCCRTGRRPTRPAGCAGHAPALGTYGSQNALPPARCNQRNWRRPTAPVSRWTSPRPQWAVTPGQSAVLYDGEVCLGGGIITAMA